MRGGSKGMSNLPKLFCEKGKKWPQYVTLDKTVVYRKERRWEIYLKSSQYIEKTKFYKLQESIKETLPEIGQVDIKICYPNKIEILKESFDDYWDILMQDIKYHIPSCGPWIDSCYGSIKDDEICILVDNPVAMEFFKFKELDHYIRDCIYQTFRWHIPVKLKLRTDSNIEEHNQQYIAEREHETKEILDNIACKIKDEQEAIESGNKRGNGNNTQNRIMFGKLIKDSPIHINELSDEHDKITIDGKIFDIEVRDIRNNKKLISIDITDYTNSITIKLFCDNDKSDGILAGLKKDVWIRVYGKYQYDKFQHEMIIMANSIMSISPKERYDTSDEKRVELHLHTQMSSMDAISPAKALIERAAKWGHPAIAITDHGVVQAFPEAYDAASKYGIKVIYGVEAYLINDCKPLITNSNNQDFNQTFVVLDIETTGLDPRNDQITEIGAVKIKNKKVIDTFKTFVNPEKLIPEKITKLTGITDDMVKDAPTIDTVMPEFKAFFSDAPLVAHNASFDIGFIKEKCKKINVEIKNPIVDTLTLSRELLKDIKKHKLDIVAKRLGVQLENHHRALDDAKATADILIKLFGMLEQRGINNLNAINHTINKISNLNGLENNHAVILVKNQTGLRNLYILVSKSHLDYFYRKPRIPKSLLMQYREGLIIGSGCEAGELYKSILRGKSEDVIYEIASFYDYLEIQPLGNNEYLLREEQVENIDALKDINRQIVHIGEQMEKPVVATGDVHFLDPYDEYYRRILMHGQGFSDADFQAPLYFKTTQEMLNEFDYLGEQKSREVVIYNPRAIADKIDNVKPIPDELYPPEIPGAEEEISTKAIQKAKDIYGDPLPEIVQKRLDKELNSIINNGFAVLYLIAHKLVKKSLSDGYLVGSRGSVGSSFVATMTDITEVNPLPPHYVCPNCKHSDFDIDVSKYGCGADLPDKDCPICGTPYNKNGFDIPFEVFLGFKGDKVPDIDLNFSGDYQPVAHKYTEELFGVGHVFRAGTIGTIAEKTAYGFVRKYLDEKEIKANNAETKRLVNGCTGIKRTTGQHPGGVMVVPKNNEIFQFSPIQYPADAKDSGVITTHFDYHSISSRLVKLDILGHDDPTVIRMLEDLTGIDARSIPIGEKKTMALFSGTDSLGVSAEEINCPVGTLGIPEFGTKFVRQMLVDTTPTTFAELIRISGLSHGTDVWLNNAQDLIRDGVAELSEVICTRDDIMLSLIQMGVEPTKAFKIMESVRKGRGLTDDFEQEMIKNKVPDWFIDSCKKIKYMFPKAHAAAYVIMAFRIAYFKVYYPEAFYATYFTVRADDFDLELVLKGKEEVRKTIKELEQKGNEISTKEKGLLTVLEIVLEMYCRGIEFLPVDLYNSDAVKFVITDKGIRPPFNSLPGIGINAAKSIVAARDEADFISIEDFRQRSKVSKSVVEILQNHGALDGLPETSQISLFSIAFD